jgi:hypothetical protein
MKTIEDEDNAQSATKPREWIGGSACVPNELLTQKRNREQGGAQANDAAQQ